MALAPAPFPRPSAEPETRAEPIPRPVVGWFIEIVAVSAIIFTLPLIMSDLLIVFLLQAPIAFVGSLLTPSLLFAPTV